MSQHDFDIANQLAAAARGDLNFGLKALASLSAGPTAPTTPYGNMWWLDTSSNLLKLRNNANTAWIDVALVNQTTNTFEILSGGGAKEDLFWENDQIITANYTITNGKNAGTFGPITINNGVTVTVGDGETWTVV